MRFAEKTITLKDGRTCILKPATPDLAEELIRFLKQITAETPFLTRYPDEVDKKAEEEAEFLKRNGGRKTRRELLLLRNGRQAEESSPLLDGHCPV